jgi:hypothetical protein
MGEMRNTYKIFIGKAEWINHLGSKAFMSRAMKLLFSIKEF